MATLTLSLDETRVKAWKLTGIVSLRDSSLQKVPAAVWSIGLSVRVLDLGGNSLLELPLEVGSLTNLQSLQINGNGLKDGTISWQGLSSLSQLMMLTVDNNLLTVLPPEIGKLSALKSLNISNNKLTCLPEELGNLLQLEKLDLSHNCLSALPSNLGRCIQLVEINLSANQLTTIPTTFGQLRSLKVLLSLLSQMASCILCQNLWKFGCWVVPSIFFFWCISCFAFDWELESEMRCRYSFLTTMH
jgi:hypothetical protein